MLICVGWTNLNTVLPTVHTICDQYENVVIAGDFNLPNINW